MKASRLVRLLLLLQVRGRTTAARLAGELEVSVRTVYRDVEALSAAGVPVWAEGGHGGGIQLVDGYETRLTGMTGDEAAALGLAGMPSAAAELGLGSLLVAAQSKLDAALPPELRSRAARVRERFLVDAPGWFDRAEPVPCLPALAAAVWEGRRVELRYRRGRDGEIVDRRADPLGLVLKAGTWYLVAAVDGDLRTYRAGRVESVARTEEPAERPAAFELAAAWTELGQAFAADLLSYEVTALVRTDALTRLRYATTREAADAAIEGARPAPGRDGWSQVTVMAESLEVAHDELLRMGADVEVLAPAALRARLRATAAAMVGRYAEAGRSPADGGCGAGS